MDIGVLLCGLFLVSFGSLGQAVKVLISRPDTAARYWGRVMLAGTIVMNVTILLHLHVAVTQQSFGPIGDALLSMAILLSPVVMVYASYMMSWAQKAKNDQAGGEA